MTKDRGEDLSGSEESDESAGSGSQAPPGAGEASDRDERAVEAQSVPEGGGAATEQPNPTYTPFFQTSFGTMDRAVLEEPEGVLRNGVALEVMKRDGRKQQLKAFKLRARITRLMKGLNDDFVFPELVVQKVVAGAYNNVKTSELDSLMAETAAYLATDHPDYSMLAARVSVTALHKRTSPSFAATVKLLHEYIHPETLIPCKKIADDVAEIIAANAEMLDAAVRYERDFRLDYFGFKTLEKAYLLRINAQVVERPQHMFMRVAVGIHKTDLQAALQTYELMSDKFFTHATPTLFNAGTPHNQLSSCFLLQTEDDSIQGIYATLAKCAKISSEAGGIGIAVHNIRARGSYMHSTHGAANGLVPMMRVYNATARFCDQGAGKRPGAFAVYLEPWHAEVLDFLELKKNTGSEETRARDLFYALWVPDLLMQRCLDDGVWSLFCPTEAVGLADCFGAKFKELYEGYERAGKARRTMKARELWFAILEAQIENGTPYLLFKDACNAKSNQQNLGVIKCSNLCTEIIEYTAPDEVAVCNLASVCLPRCLRDGVFDHQVLYEVVCVMARNLNKIIDINSYPIEDARRSNLRHRPIGIGVQGLADVFLLLRLPFESEGARRLNRDIFETIYFAAMSTSQELAAVEGPYSTYEGSPASQGRLQFDLWGVEPSDRWDWAGLKAKIAATGIRNSLTVAPMPTASTAQIMGNAECFEPYTSNLYNRRVMAGDFPVVNPHMLLDLTRLGLWTPEMKHRLMAADGSIQGIAEIPAEIKALYKTAWEIKQRCIIDMAADRGAFIDQSQSLNLFMEAPTVAKLTSMHFYTWRKGLKTGVYYLRTRAAADAIKFTVDHHTVVEARNQARNSPLPVSQRNSPASSEEGVPSLGWTPGPVEGGGGAREAGELVRAKREVERRLKEAARARCAQDGDSCLMCGS